jgi:hypothetical protein
MNNHYHLTKAIPFWKRDSPQKYAQKSFKTSKFWAFYSKKLSITLNWIFAFKKWKILAIESEIFLGLGSFEILKLLINLTQLPFFNARKNSSIERQHPYEIFEKQLHIWTLDQGKMHSPRWTSNVLSPKSRKEKCF